VSLSAASFAHAGAVDHADRAEFVSAAVVWSVCGLSAAAVQASAGLQSPESASDQGKRRVGDTGLEPVASAVWRNATFSREPCVCRDLPVRPPARTDRQWPSPTMS